MTVLSYLLKILVFVFLGLAISASMKAQGETSGRSKHANCKTFDARKTEG